VTDGQTELRQLRGATAVAVVACKNWHTSTPWPWKWFLVLLVFELTATQETNGQRDERGRQVLQYIRRATQYYSLQIC